MRKFILIYIVILLAISGCADIGAGSVITSRKGPIIIGEASG